MTAAIDAINSEKGESIMIDVSRLVGRSAVLIPANRNGNRIDVTIIGFCQNETLMVAPKDDAIELSDAVMHSQYQLRASVENVFYTFNTHIMTVHNEPITYLHLSLPDVNKNITERQSPRIAVHSHELTLSVNTGSEQLSASIADLSLQGARLVAKNRLARVDETFYIDMLVDKGTSTITLPCRVRYIRTDIQTTGQDSIVFHHGVEFGDLSENAEHFISAFVSSSAYH